MSSPVMKGPVKWTRPEEVMRFHQMKVKKRKLQERMKRTALETPIMVETTEPTSNSSDSCSTEDIFSLLESPTKCRNPFRTKKHSKVQASSRMKPSSDRETLFDLLDLDDTSETGEDAGASRSSASFFSQTSRETNEEPVEVKKGKDYLPVDWTLKTKLRFMSLKPFAWSQNLRTSEEAAGITGFVRCSGTDPEKERWLDTSPNARFHQSCLLWQHPSLPWLTLFPRTHVRGYDSKSVVLDVKMKEALYQDYTESFRSLFQLLRVRQCPYFYYCANKFTCLFRAAGICGQSDVQAFLTPTTKGFREMLTKDDVLFTLPLEKRRSRFTNLLSGPADAPLPTASQIAETELDDRSDLVDDDDEWLERLLSTGVPDNINSARIILTWNRDTALNRTPESLVQVGGIEAQALFNFLLNRKSEVVGVPPTLLSPVAFHGATLRPLKVRQSVVKVDAKHYHSVELCGPVLPHMIHNLCALLEDSQQEYSATFSNLEETSSFCQVAHAPPPSSPTPAVVDSPSTAPTPSAFNHENLSDCGLSPRVLEAFCSPDPGRVQAVEAIKFNSDKTYTWQ